MLGRGLRTARRSARLGRLFVECVVKEGPRAAFGRARAYRTAFATGSREAAARATASGDVLFVSACRGGTRRYRCEHAVEQLALVGYSASVVLWPHADLAPLIDRFETFVLQRVPYDADVRKFLASARQRGKRVLFDIDDLMIDARYAPGLGHLAYAGRFERELAERHLRDLGRTLRACDGIVVSTTPIQRACAALCPQVPCWVHRNRVSQVMLDRSAACRERRSSDTVVLGYFSGTATHIADFAVIVSALVRLFERHASVRLLLVGEIQLPRVLQPFSDRIDVRGLVEWRDLPALIASADINLVPLQNTEFAAAKSTIKWLEAALVRRPTIATATRAHCDELCHEEHALLVAPGADWFPALERLVTSRGERARLAEAAHALALEHYTPVAGGTSWRQILTHCSPARA